MRWQTSKGEVSPVFEDSRNEGYYYRLKSYMDIHTRQEYPKELIQPEIFMGYLSFMYYLSFLY